jgi:hypothetical protein
VGPGALKSSVEHSVASSQLASSGDRWFGAGNSLLPDSRAAGSEAAAGAMAMPDAGLIIVFASDAYDYQPLLAGIREVTGDAPLIGCSTAGEITAAGSSEASVVVVALGGPGFTVATARASTHGGSREAGESVAEALCRIDAPHKILLVLADSVAANHQGIVLGARARAGADIPVVGACAAEGGLRMRRTTELWGDRVMERGVVAAAIGSTGPFGIGVRHGWRAIGEPMTIRWDARGRLSSLDDVPALDGYLNRLGAPEEVRWDPYLFMRFSRSRPLGLVSHGSVEDIRGVGDPDFEDRTLDAQAIDIPEGGLVWVMEGEPASLMDSAETACQEALGALSGPPLGLVVFDCEARKSILLDQRDAEIDRIVRHSGGAPIGGFYSYGEIATTRGRYGYHHGTLVVVALG